MTIVQLLLLLQYSS